MAEQSIENVRASLYNESKVCNLDPNGDSVGERYDKEESSTGSVEMMSSKEEL